MRRDFTAIDWRHINRPLKYKHYPPPLPSPASLSPPPPPPTPLPPAFWALQKTAGAFFWDHSKYEYSKDSIIVFFCLVFFWNASPFCSFSSRWKYESNDQDTFFLEYVECTFFWERSRGKITPSPPSPWRAPEVRSTRSERVTLFRHRFPSGWGEESNTAIPLPSLSVNRQSCVPSSYTLSQQSLPLPIE